MWDDVESVESLTVNVKTAAKMLNVCERTVRNLTKRGELPVVRIGSSVRYSRKVLHDFVEPKEPCGGNEKIVSSPS